MFTVTVTEKGGSATVREFDQPEVTIGRIQGNDIVLPKSNVSKRHARIINNGNAFVIVDSKSTNGTYINGKRIEAPYDLNTGDKIYVGDFTLEIEPAIGMEKALLNKAPPPPPADPVKAKPQEASGSDLLSDDEWGVGSDLEQEWADDWADERDGGTNTSAQEKRQRTKSRVQATDDLRRHSNVKTVQSVVAERRKSSSNVLAVEPQEPEKAAQKPAKDPSTAADQPLDTNSAKPGDDDVRVLRRVHERLLRAMDFRHLDIENMREDDLRERTRKAVQDVVAAMRKQDELPATIDSDTLIKRVLDEALGLGPLEDLQQDDSITEILVNNSRQIYVERNGQLELSDRTFSNDYAILGVIERIVARVGRHIDENSPMVDVRLKDGSRVNAIIPPLSIRGPTLTIRKLNREPLQIDDLVGYGTLAADMSEFLEMCIHVRRNILISGGTGSGKTTTLNVLASYIPDSERIITIEDAAELKLEQPHVVSLEAQPANVEGHGAITIRDLVRNALRMRPDRIVVGDCRGGETLDILQAMNTGQEGSLTSIHANSPYDALSRLETMVLMSGMDLPTRAIRDQISNAINIVVQQARLADGTRRITHISEITGIKADAISMQDIFIFDQQGFDTNGRVMGRHKATGCIPKFYESLKVMGIKANMDVFQNH